MNLARSFFGKLIVCLFFSVFASFIQLRAQPEKLLPLYEQTSEVNNIMVQYKADYGNLTRFYMIRNSPERRERLISVVNQYLGKLSELEFERLNTSAKVDYVLFRRDLRELQHSLQKEEQEYNAIKGWIPFADSIYAVEKRRRRGAVQDGQHLASLFTEIFKKVDELQQKLKGERSISYELGDRAEGTLAGLRYALKSTFDFYNGYDPLFSWWVPQPYHRLDSLLGVYSDSIRSKEKSARPQKDDGSGIAGNPIGLPELKRRLQYEMIPYSPDELVAIANKELAWCHGEMLKASHEMGFGDNWKSALEKVKECYVPPGEQPSAMLKLYDESVQFIKQHDLISLPPLAEETWRMRMMTPEEQLINPFFTGGEEFSISYPVSTMSQEEKLMSMRGNNPHFSRATVHHELLAGHALQEYSQRRYKTYRHFESPFWVEGWALYWEMLLWDQGFARTPEDRIGMLFWRMHRCARIIFSLNYHSGKWTPQQCIDFLVDEIGHEPANAQAEVRRSFVGHYDPLYQIAYMIGGLQIMSLKKELVDSGKMTYKQFHDSFLQQNVMPIEMERAILENKPPEKDFKSSWKFYKF